MTTTLTYGLYFALLTVWLFMLPVYRDATRRQDPERGLLARKPFSCIYCLAFWLGLIGSAFIHLSQGGSFGYAVVLPAPVASVLAVAIDKAIKALPNNF